MNDLKDRIVMITGASSGFGKEAAKMCVGLGAKVVLGARREDKLKELCDELGSNNATYKSTDVTSKGNIFLSWRQKSTISNVNFAIIVLVLLL